ncbi:ribonuclease E/G [Ferrovibrio sp.]|uniref:ribonuclease E/G n=1 Tax=Ferrovibrio sp. TaxID=1917215 RepID=UPI001B4F22D1|nr:ribonuclease E/G [Ferrovibrio sp.]MBP7063060.1 ribonuclease E/G [Ferrovibrio sp.]
MANELLIDVGLTETRVALVEEDRLVHLDLERPDRDSALGAIFLGRVRLIEPGLQAAYIDIGLARDGFLNATDLAPDHDGEPARPIEQRLAEGDALLVQVIRDPVGEKGVKLTARPSLPGRFLSLTPFDDRVRVSRRIIEDAERMRLAAVMQSLLALGDKTPVQVSTRMQRRMGERRVGQAPLSMLASGLAERRQDDKRKPMGCLVDSAAEKAEQEALAADLQRLRARWIAIEERRSKAQAQGQAPAELWREMGPVGRALRNHVGARLDTIRVNDARGFAEARAWLFEHAPELVGKLERYDDPGPLFELFEIESDIDSALSRRVVLPSGGALLFGETDALTAIDVDMAKAARRGNDFDELALRINLEAAEEIARQLRLRGIGGIVVIDFLHMASSAFRAQAVNALRRALARDPAPVKVLGMSALGLVEMTRKRIGEPLSARLFEACPTCDGDGRIPSLPAVQAELIRRAVQEAAASPRGSRFEIRCAPDVAALFDSALLGQLQHRIGAQIAVRPESGRRREVFDIDRVA